MPTSIHLPKHLLAALARKAKALGISRNRVIVQALERDLANASEWPPGFFDKFTPLAPGDAKAIDEMIESIRAGRASRKPVRL